MAKKLDVKEVKAFTISTATLQVRLVKFNGKPSLDIRRYYKDVDDGGKMKPSSKGIALDHSFFLTLKAIIEEHADQIEKFLEPRQIEPR